MLRKKITSQSVPRTYGSPTRYVFSSRCCHHFTDTLQTIDNACATIALLNIVMNAPEIELGPALFDFKESTYNLVPYRRGEQLGNNGFIRAIHNSFARFVTPKYIYCDSTG